MSAPVNVLFAYGGDNENRDPDRMAQVALGVDPSIPDDALGMFLVHAIRNLVAFVEQRENAE